MLLKSKIDPDWCFVENQFDIINNRHYESVFSLGTGFMTTRGSIEEEFENDDQSAEFERRMDNTTLEKPREIKSRWGTFMSVVQAEHPTLRTGIVNLPYYLGLNIVVDGEKLDLEKSSIRNYFRWLDAKTGTLHRGLTWETQGGKQVEINWRRFMNPKDRFVCVQDVAISSNQVVEVVIESFVDNNVRTNGFDKFTSHSVGSKDNLIYSDVTTNRQNRIVTASQCFYNHPVEQKVDLAARKATSHAWFRLESGETLELRKISVTATDLYFPSDQVLETAQNLINENMKFKGDALHERHCAVWAELWKQSDIEIQAKDAPGYNSQLAIRLAIFHLLKAKGLEDRALLCPKGNTTEAYYGSVFWDFEVFCCPISFIPTRKLAEPGPLSVTEAWILPGSWLRHVITLARNIPGSLTVLGMKLAYPGSMLIIRYTFQLMLFWVSGIMFEPLAIRNFYMIAALKSSLKRPAFGRSAWINYQAGKDFTF
jgi:trehalose/maltose hydrolase-like predicted phosphorylase